MDNALTTDLEKLIRNYLKEYDMKVKDTGKSEEEGRRLVNASPWNIGEQVTLDEFCKRNHIAAAEYNNVWNRVAREPKPNNPSDRGWK